MYRVTEKVSDLGWGDPSAGGPVSWLPTAQAGWWNISNLSQPNPVRDPLGHPVFGGTFIMILRELLTPHLRTSSYTSKISFYVALGARLV